MPSSKQRQSASSTDNNDPRTDGGTVRRNPGHDPAWRRLPDPDEEIEVTADCCPDCSSRPSKAVDITPRFSWEIPDPEPIETTRDDLHFYPCDVCGTDVQTTHPDCPAEGGFGVLAKAALAGYEYWLPFPKIADWFDKLFDLDLSAASAWQVTEQMAHAGRDEYLAIREHIRSAEVILVDEPGLQLSSHQWWLWTFRSEEETLFEIRESRATGVIDETLDEDFDGTIVCDGWTAVPAVTDNLQRCWAHLLQEADDLATDHAEAEPIADRLHRLFDGLQAFLASDLTVGQREQMGNAPVRRCTHLSIMTPSPAKFRSFWARSRVDWATGWGS